MMLEAVITGIGVVACAALGFAWRVRSTLGRRIKGHDLAIADLRRAVALLTAPDNRPTGAHRPAFPRAEVTVISPSPLPAEDRSRVPASLHAADDAGAHGDLSPEPEAARATTRYHELLAAERAAGRRVDHCRGAECASTDAAPRADLCMCSCDGCVAALVILRLAEREIMGPGIGPDSDPVPDGDRPSASASADARPASSPPASPAFAPTPPRSRGAARAAELAAEVKRSRPPGPSVTLVLGPASPAAPSEARTALPSVAAAGDEDSEDDSNTRIMTKPSALAPAEHAAGLGRPRAAPLHPRPRRTSTVMGLAPPPGAPAQSSHRPPAEPARHPTLLSRVSPVLADARVGGDDEETIEQKR
jgi:hypothetical protein